MWKRIVEFFKMLFSFLLEDAEKSVPLERRLAYDRGQKAENIKKMTDGATEVAARGEELVRGVAEAKIFNANLEEKVKYHLIAAKNAKAKGDSEKELQEMAKATEYANELGEERQYLADLEKEVASILKDKKEAKQMVLDQSDELAKLARHDARLVAQVRMAEMRAESNALRESLMDLIPEDRDNIRARALASAQKLEDKTKARKEIVDALWEKRREQKLEQKLDITAAGASILVNLKKSVGYEDETAEEEPKKKAASS